MLHRGLQVFLNAGNAQRYTQLRWIVHHSIIIGLQHSKHITARKSQIIYACCSSTLCMYFNNASKQIKKRRAILEPTSLLVCFALSCSAAAGGFLIEFYGDFACAVVCLMTATHTHTQHTEWDFFFCPLCLFPTYIFRLYKLRFN